MKQEVKEFWRNFCQKHNWDESTKYDAWSFGTDKNGLADKVNRGVKTATTSAYEFYEDKPLPQVGELSVILDEAGKPVCVVREKVVEIVPYNQISAEHAYHEGDGTYKNWRQIHDDFFKKEYESKKRAFYPQAPMVCEVFEKVE